MECATGPLPKQPPGSLAAVALALIVLMEPLSAQSLDVQRQAFRDVYPAAELGNWEAVAARADVLEDYVLWPDLQAAWLRRHLAEEERVERFLERYRDLKPAREIRYRHAQRLARLGRHREFLAIYAAHYASLGEPVLDCLAAAAEIAVGNHDAALRKGRRLWLTGRSQAKQCDPVFAWMRKEGKLTQDLLRRRYELALDEREFLLARYIARSLGDDDLEDANRWLRARGDPDSFLARADVSRSDETYTRQLSFAARRLAIRKPIEAWRHWSRLRRDIRFADEQDLEVAQDVALWSARRNLDEADRLLGRLDPRAIDDEVRRWRIRNALRSEDWRRVLATIEALSYEERDRQEWRFWKAVSLDRLGEAAEAMLLFGSLAQERSYYGFLAADQLGVDYALRPVAIQADERVIARLAADPALIRARELRLTGLDGRGRAEWNAVVRGLGKHEKAQAALLAERWNWPSRAIALAAQADRLDSLDLRYPLPHLDDFRQSSATAGIRESWAYGIARSESIFMRDVRSSAGAVGLMQLMPATGRKTARELRLPYDGLKTLTDPSSNIRLGATYLGKMQERFDGHPAVATAAYNAGPNRVARWLPESSAQDARVWVETIPFRETRDYVRRVLTSDVIFGWRLTGRAPRLSDRLGEIRPRRSEPPAAAQ